MSDFGSGHELAVGEFKPELASMLKAQIPCLTLSVCSFLPLSVPVSLCPSKINKY